MKYSYMPPRKFVLLDINSKYWLIDKVVSTIVLSVTKGAGLIKHYNQFSLLLVLTGQSILGEPGSVWN